MKFDGTFLSVYNPFMYRYYGKKIPYLFLIPAGVILLLFFFIPFISTLGISFLDYSKGLYEPCFVGFKNYFTLFHSAEFFEVFKNSFLFLLYVVPALTILPLIPAIILNSGIRGANLYKILMYMPVIVSMVAVAVAFKQLYAWDGILNYLLKKIIKRMN